MLGNFIYVVYTFICKGRFTYRRREKTSLKRTYGIASDYGSCGDDKEIEKDDKYEHEFCFISSIIC
jgi:hypothetical protein